MKIILFIKNIILLVKNITSVITNLKFSARKVKFNIFFRYLNKKFKTEEVLNNIVLNKVDYIAIEPFYQGNINLKSFLNLKQFMSIKDLNCVVPDFYIVWGTSPLKDFTDKIINCAIKNKKPCLIAEDAFIRSIQTFADKDAEIELKHSVSITVDYKGCHYEGGKPTHLEDMLNSVEVSQEEILKANKLIEFIVNNHITKYNHQPIFHPEIGRKNASKVLVIDQSYGDYSIKGALASDKTFKVMLETAIRENPDADIIVKTHPDTLTGSKGGYYTKVQQENNIYPVTFKINPISLINYVDKVYVVSSQFGFEALMCKKEVVSFGVPFYSNWGLTDDRKICSRRKRKRSLEEVFAITYLKYCLYQNPETGKRCTIEEALDYILRQREKFFKGACK